MGGINVRLELLNKHSKNIPVLKKIERKIGLETGSSAMIALSVLFSIVLFESFSQFIVEIYALAYPIYGSLYSRERYWLSYWILYSLVLLVFSLLPNINFFLTIRFLITTYLIAPNTARSIEFHEYLIKTLYEQIIST